MVPSIRIIGWLLQRPYRFYQRSAPLPMPMNRAKAQDQPCLKCPFSRIARF